MEPGNGSPITEICAEKLVEIITKGRVSGHLDKYYLYGKNQYGYCKEISVFKSLLV